MKKRGTGNLNYVNNNFSRVGKKGMRIIVPVLIAVVLAEVFLLANGSYSDSYIILFRIIGAFLICLFFWSPASAGLGLVLIGFAETAYGQSAGNLVVLAVALGLVVYTCPLWFIAAYTLAASALACFTIFSTYELAAAAPLALVALSIVCSFIGAQFRDSMNREIRHMREINESREHRSNQIQDERHRIADELHDVIAHDLTLIVMHSRVLEKVDDSALRERSLKAIHDSSRQALTDIRRVLHVIRDHENSSSEELDEIQEGSVNGHLEDSCAQLQHLGSHVQLEYDENIEMTKTIKNAYFKIVNELTSNAAKHAPIGGDIFIGLSLKGDATNLIFVNDTAGGSPLMRDVPSSGYGLSRIQERVALLGGSYSLRQSADKWTVDISLPRS